MRAVQCALLRGGLLVGLQVGLPFYGRVSKLGCPFMGRKRRWFDIPIHGKAKVDNVATVL